MTKQELPHDLSNLRLNALSRWDNEGGTVLAAAHEAPEAPQMTNSEIVLLRVRVIALENILIAIMAEGPERNRQAVNEMADVISPRLGSTQHALTLRAAQHMHDLGARAVHIKKLRQ